MTRVSVFVGPSLRGGDLPGSSFCKMPPARRGDLLALRKSPSPVLILADGLWGTVPAVSHHEIQEIIRRGIAVLGCSSIGAIRAAELECVGMMGCGSVFERFRSGELVRDDEVALLHAPSEFSYVPITFALVEFRDTCARLHGRSALSLNLLQDLVSCASHKPVNERDTSLVVNECVTPKDEADRVLRLLLEEWVPSKTLDLLRCAQVAETLSLKEHASNKVETVLHRTSWGEQILLQYHPAGDGTALDVIDVARLYSPELRKKLSVLLKAFWATPQMTAGSPLDEKLIWEWSQREGIGNVIDVDHELRRREITRTDAAWALHIMNRVDFGADHFDDISRSESAGIPLWFIYCWLRLNKVGNKCVELTNRIIRCHTDRPFDPVEARQEWAESQGVSPREVSELAFLSGFTTDSELLRALKITHAWRSNGNPVG